MALSQCQQAFLAEDVPDDHALLSKVQFAVSAVDRRTRRGDGSNDLCGFFWTGTPERGKWVLEHKYIFGRDKSAFDSARRAQGRDSGSIRR